MSRIRVARAAKRANDLVTTATGAADPLGGPRFASIVVDVLGGRTLYKSDPNGLRHPASLTKVMTLYLLFEQLQAGHMTLDTQMPVSAHAAAQAPTKLGLRAGDTLRVEDAIRGIVTRSANDAAVVIAEAIGGSEDHFAELMTRKARQLGMTRTSYHNASGLPDPQQLTTAHDLAVLGIALQDRFPQYYPYFSTRSFVFRGHVIGGHNHLLGSVEGVDGIKTGYTRASGFNLLTSIKRDGRQLIAVVLGGTSVAARDATMRRLIDATMPTAYAGLRRSPSFAIDTQVADATPGVPLPKAKPAVVAETSREAPQAPVAVQARLAASSDIELPVARPLQIGRPAFASTSRSGPVLRWVTGPAPVSTAPATPPVRTADADAASDPGTTSSVQSVHTTTFKVDEDTQTVSELPSDSGDQPAANTDNVKASAGKPAALRPLVAKATANSKQTVVAEAHAAPAHTGWIIQIGATDSENGAKALLERARATGHRTLASAEPFTETVQKNGSTFWRARFGGFEAQADAQAACMALKKGSFDCMTARL